MIRLRRALPVLVLVLLVLGIWLMSRVGSERIGDGLMISTRVTCAEGCGRHVDRGPAG